MTTIERGFAPVGDLRMYYEIHGAGEPLLLLHGALMHAESCAGLIAGFRDRFRVIFPEMQGHGRTGDLSHREVRYPTLADDCAALLDWLGIERAHVVGFSLGGSVALRLAMQHPNLVRTVVVAAAVYRWHGLKPDVLDGLANTRVEEFDGSEVRAAFERLSPTPKAFPAVLRRLIDLELDQFDWTDELVAIGAPTLLVCGDRDVVRPEHMLAAFELLSAGAFERGKHPSTVQLAILPNTSHAELIERADFFSLAHAFLTGGGAQT